jgi:hypothetical protein
MTSSSHSSNTSGVFSWSGYFRKLYKTSVFKYILEFKGAACVALAFKIFVRQADNGAQKPATILFGLISYKDFECQS